MRNPDGTLLGCVTNEAAEQVKAFVPEKTALQRKDALLAAQQQLLQYGVTNVNDMGTSLEDVHDLKALYESGEYKLRFHGALHYRTRPDAPADEKAYLAQCPEIDLYNGHFTVRACKLLGDGAVGSQSACLKQDYSDRPGHRGVKMRTDSELYACVREAAEHGMQMIIHAIGDDTIDQVLRVYQQVLQDVPTPDHRWHIEHFQTVDGDQPERARELGGLAQYAAPSCAEQRVHGTSPSRARSRQPRVRRRSCPAKDRAYLVGIGCTRRHAFPSERNARCYYANQTTNFFPREDSSRRMP